MSDGGSGPRFGERAAPGAGDVCYRHPQQASFTLCQRCGRTICPTCQNVSAVGVLCPECVRDTRPGTAQRASRTARATTRRLADSDTPVVTYGIIAVSFAVFLAQLASHYFGADGVTLALWYAPLYSYPELFEPWRMVTVMFTHSVGFLFHILFNMLALWLFGRNLEHMIGRIPFLVLYLFAGVGGALGSMFWAYVDPASIQTPTVGASGAIFGIMAATFVAYKALNANVMSLAVLIAVNFGIGLLPGTSIAWQAHLGGLLVGGLTMWVIFANRGPRHKRRRVVGLVAVGVALAALASAYFVVPPMLVGFA